MRNVSTQQGTSWVRNRHWAVSWADRPEPQPAASGWTAAAAIDRSRGSGSGSVATVSLGMVQRALTPSHLSSLISARLGAARFNCWLLAGCGKKAQTAAIQRADHRMSRGAEADKRASKGGEGIKEKKEESDVDGREGRGGEWKERWTDDHPAAAPTTSSSGDDQRGMAIELHDGASVIREEVHTALASLRTRLFDCSHSLGRSASGRTAAQRATTVRSPGGQPQPQRSPRPALTCPTFSHPIRIQ